MLFLSPNPRLLVLAACASVLFPACASKPLTVPPVAAGFPRASEAPVTTVHMMLVTPETLPAFLAAKEDVGRKVGRWWRAGDGSVSLRLSTAKDSRANTLQGVECGGVLFVPGPIGEVCHLHIHNERDVPVEAVVSVHHADLIDGGEPSTIKPGTPINSHKTRTIKARLSAKSGQAVPLVFKPMATPEGLFRYDWAAQQGVIRVAVHPADRNAPQMQPKYLLPALNLPSSSPPPAPRMSTPYEYR